MSVSLFQTDGAYYNLVTGLGTKSADKDEHTRVIGGIQLPDWHVLGAQYLKDGIVRRLANGPAVKALKNPIVLPDDKEDKIYNALALPTFDFFGTCIEAGTWARLFGGALVVSLFENDGDGDLSKEPGKSDKVVGYRIYTPGRVMLTDRSIQNDTTSKWFGKVEVFTVQNRNGSTTDVHASRCHLFRGIKVPDILDSDIHTYVFGASEVDAANIGLKKLPGAFGAISNMLQENGLTIFGIDGLASMLATEGGIQKVRERMNVVKLGMGSMHAVFQDKNDTFDMKSHSMSDVPESVKMLMAYVSALTNIPVSILFGNMVSGLSSTNEGDIRQYNDMVSQWRNACLYAPMVEMLTEYMNRNEGRSGPQSFQWGEISESTEMEKADLFEKKVNSCKTLFDIGAMSPKEIRSNLIVNGGTSEITVKTVEIPKDGQNNAQPQAMENQQ